MTARLHIHYPVVMFDLDGTLVDSEPVLWRTVQQVLAEFRLATSLGHRLGHHAPRVRDVADSLSWAHRAEFEAGMTSRLDVVVEELAGRVAPCAMDLLGRCRDAGRRTALVTNSSREYTTRVLERIDARGLFDVITTADDVSAPKPAPDPYARTMALLGVRPQDCVAFEDSAEGIRSAQDAGIFVVAVRARCEMGQERCFHDVELATR